MTVLPPAGPPGTAGLSMPTAGVCVIIDYQNVHLTGRDLFARRSAPRASQVHPLLFAERVVAARAIGRQADDQEDVAVVQQVLVFRGQPRYDREPRLYHMTDAQRTEWTRDSRVRVTYRSLKYPPLWPVEPAREKGIDVEVALALLTTAEDAESEIVILATHDTDFEPALEVANRRKGNGVQVETAGWRGGRRLGRHLRLRHTGLDAAEFELSRDRKSYTIRSKAVAMR